MSDQKLISPLLDGFIMGDAMSNHDGVQCCPAIRENTEEKYIVKIISVPASQKQLDALLLTGAYPDAASATNYFKDVADGIVKEAEILKQLSRLEGFLPYDDWQIVPMAGSKLGYRVYLLSPYRRSLEKHLLRNTMTHLGAVNLGLDLCTALSVCRRAGFMHVDLQPSNIFITGQREFRIGDLGFVKLNSLKYTSLPVKYCSSYTPPELHDALTTLNPTADIYAVGMILYQIYNNGVLPYEDREPGAELPAPLNADYELAEIILKACAPDPRNRWQTPIEMGQALVEYMKRNRVTDDPIAAPVVEGDFMDASYESASVQTESAESVQTESPEFVQPEPPTPTAAQDEQIEEDVQDLDHVAISDEISAMLAHAEKLLAEVETEIAESREEPVSEDIPAEPAEEAAAIVDEPIPEHVKIPDGIPAPSAPFIPAPPPKPLGDKILPDERPKKKHTFLKVLMVLLLLGALAFGGYYYYENYYLLHIEHLAITADDSFISVELTTEVDDNLLRVVCSDPYGNSTTSSVNDRKAVFTDLSPDTLYKIEVVTEGFHDMKGSFTGMVTTAARTEISDLVAEAGPEENSVTLQFDAEGPEQDWIVEYVAEGEEMHSLSFTGHTVTVTGLTVGKEYTFTLSAPENSGLYVGGTNQVQFTVTRNVAAEKLAIISLAEGVLTVQWNTPAGEEVKSWTVRCYDGKDYDKTVTVTGNTAEFTDIVAGSAYTVEVTAENSSQTVRTYLTENPVTVSDVTVDDSVAGKLTLTWNSGDVIPKDGWLLVYTLNSGTSSEVIKCAANTAVIEQTIPGAQYHFTVQAADGTTVLGGICDHTTPSATIFKGYGINSSEVTGSFLPTPQKSGWTHKDVSSDSYSSTYAPGAKVSLLLYSPAVPNRAYDAITVMYVFRDSRGNILPQMTSAFTNNWYALWNSRSQYVCLDLPAVPMDAGEYTVEVYFNRSLMITKKLTITE